MPIWSSYAAVILIVLTTVVIYSIDSISSNGEAHWIHVSGLLNGGCSSTTGEFVAAGIGNFGYGIAFALISESFRRVYWEDGDLIKYLIGLLSILFFYLVLGFATGRSLGLDIVHHVSSGLGILALFVYAILSLNPYAYLQIFATVAMFFSGIALIVTYSTGIINTMGWNGFVGSQLAFGISFMIFLVVWANEAQCQRRRNQKQKQRKRLYRRRP